MVSTLGKSEIGTCKLDYAQTAAKGLTPANPQWLHISCP